MRKFLSIVFLLISLLSIGQVREKGNIELTPIIGYSLSNHMPSYFFGSTPVSGIQLGLFTNYFFNHKWSLRSGILYQKMGANNIGIFSLTDKYSEKTNYITLPLMVSYHFGKSRNWHINYGASIGVLTKAKANYHDGNGFINIKEIAKPIQFGIHGGFGYKYQISPKLIITIENSNILGLTKTTKEKKGMNFFMSYNFGMILLM